MQTGFVLANSSLAALPQPKCNRRLVTAAGILFAALALCAVSAPGADQVEMKNGDRYLGQVLSLDSTTLVLQSDVLGKVSLRRSQVSTITLGAAVKALKTVAPRAAGTNPPPLGLVLSPTSNFSAAFREFAKDTNVVQQVQKKFLSDAGPEATQEFDRLLSGLMGGTISLGDLRAKAQDTANQARALRKDLGEDAGGGLDGYLAILDSFLKETESETNAPAKP